MGLSSRTLLWDTLVWLYCGTQTLVGHSCGTLLQDTLVGRSCGTLLWRNSLWTHFSDTSAGHSCGGLLESPKVNRHVSRTSVLQLPEESLREWPLIQ